MLGCSQAWSVPWLWISSSIWRSNELWRQSDTGWPSCSGMRPIYLCLHMTYEIFVFCNLLWSIASFDILGQLACCCKVCCVYSLLWLHFVLIAVLHVSNLLLSLGLTIQEDYGFVHFRWIIPRTYLANQHFLCAFYWCILDFCRLLYEEHGGRWHCGIEQNSCTIYSSK